MGVTGPFSIWETLPRLPQAPCPAPLGCPMGKNRQLPVLGFSKALQRHKVALSHPRVAPAPLALGESPELSLEAGGGEGWLSPSTRGSLPWWDLYPSQHCPGSPLHPFPVPAAGPLQSCSLGRAEQPPEVSVAPALAGCRDFGWMRRQVGASCWKRLESWNWDGDPTGNAQLRGWNVSGVKCTLKFPVFHSDLPQRPHPRKPNLCAEGCE